MSGLECGIVEDVRFLPPYDFEHYGDRDTERRARF